MATRVREAAWIMGTLGQGKKDAQPQVKAITSHCRAAEAQQRCMEVQRSEIGKWYADRILSSLTMKVQLVTSTPTSEI
eukprot:5420739-Amphidinium_carterae.3